MPIQPLEDRPAGVYIHIPFCERLCPYCDFAVAVRREQPDDAYLQALLAEFATRSVELEGRSVRSIYFGGGTPSAWPAQHIARMVREVRANLGVDADAEVTVEANPASVSPTELAIWKEAGVNRVSLGIQSFSTRYLKALGRNHEEQDARTALAMLLDAGLEVSIDLIVAGPGNDPAELSNDLKVLDDFPELGHISIYQLVVEPKTVFWTRLERDELTLPSDDAAARLLESAQDGLAARGFERYAVSSYARPGKRARHNQNYWTGGEYLGLGMGAHSFSLAGHRIVRSENTRLLETYLAVDPDRPRAHLDERSEQLSALDHLRERLFLSVRSLAGLDVESLRRQFGDVVDESVWDEVSSVVGTFVDSGLLTRRSGIYLPTRRGLNLWDTMAEAFFDIG